jgi:fructose-bisphosphate aldolase class I
MISQDLTATVQGMLIQRKGLLAIDDRRPTCNKRFAAIGIPQTAEAQQAYRELIVTAAGF